MEYAYEEILTQRQSFLLFEELYHRQYVNVKDEESQSVKEIAEKNPLLKDKIVDNLFAVISKLVRRELWWWWWWLDSQGIAGSFVCP